MWRWTQSSQVSYFVAQLSVAAEKHLCLLFVVGVVARPIGEFRSTADYQYQLLRCNVDLLKIIQLGLTFMDEDGNTAPEFSTWQFNFKFSLT